ncbi:MAG TPA: signal peptidase II [Oligoflexia bacterium]|nr:signal peptidase II [Oligoflexia bacterium]HMP26706.1 signal peptidase II [Oligoflexia bacterium]
MYFKDLRFPLLVALVVIVFDQITKWLVVSLISRSESIELIPNFLNLVLTYNKGVAFGVFANLSENYRLPLILVMTLIAISLVVYLIFVEFKGSRLANAALGMILGGAIGNFIDRLIYGEVVDFIDFYLGSYHWPAFNFADTAISTAVGILILISLFGSHNSSRGNRNFC